MKFERAKKTYENKYKQLMIIPILILILSVAILGFWKFETGEFVSKDITLKGGMLITIYTDANLDVNEIKASVESELESAILVRSLKTIGGSNIGYSFELEEMDIDKVQSAIESATGVEITKENYTKQEVSSALGNDFWQNTIRAIIIAFVFMSFVVFFYFRNIVPSGAIVLAAVSDLIGTLAILNLTGIALSTAGVAAILMLLGYSVDSNILLSTKLLKRKEGTQMERIYSALKTGLTMQFTTFSVLVVIWLISPAAILKQIALILLIGLSLDLINTWIQNTGILRWYLGGTSKSIVDVQKDE